MCLLITTIPDQSNEISS